MDKKEIAEVVKWLSDNFYINYAYDMEFCLEVADKYLNSKHPKE